MNKYILPSFDDEIYFYSQKLVFDKIKKAWQVLITPPDCLVSLTKIEPSLPAITEIRQEKIKKYTNFGLEIYEGRILFSSGIIFIINKRFMLFKRDAAAQIDPLMWTCPAGRCDREPNLTGFKEFYEEIILWDKKRKKPIFIFFPESEPYLEYLKDVYLQTLTRKDRSLPEEQWVYLHADVPAQYVPLLNEVQTFFGEFEDAEEYEGKFFVFWDEACNTLELRLLASVTVDQESAEDIECFDGEYEREAKLFTLEEFQAFPENELVSTMVEFRKRLIG